MNQKIRELKTNDLFKVSKIIKKIGLKIETKDNNGEKKSQDQLGAELIVSAFENIHLAQNEVNEFLGGLVGITGAEFGELPLDTSFEIMRQLRNMPGIESFFRKADQLTQLK